MPLGLVRDDLTRMGTDAVVTAADGTLLAGGGVDGQICRAAGPELLEARRRLGGCGIGQARITEGYRLPAKYVIHTVGPVWRGGGHGETDLLASCYRTSMELAVENGCESVAFPLISAGAFGFPPDRALRTAVDTIRDFLSERDLTVWLVLFGRDAVLSGRALFPDLAERIDDAWADAHTDLPVERRRRALFRWLSHESVPPDGAAPMGKSVPREDAAPVGGAVPMGDTAPMYGAVPIEDTAPMYGAVPKEDTASMDRAVPMEDAAPADRAASSMEEAVPMERADAAPMPPLPTPMAAASMRASAPPLSAGSLDEALRALDEGFSRTLLRKIDERGMTDAQCYRKANVDRRHFSKIRSDPAYRPSKGTVLSFAVALGLSLEETRDLLARAGFALSRSSKADIIVEYFIQRGEYDVFRINEALFAFDQPLLGV